MSTQEENVMRKELLKLSKAKLIKLCKKEKISTTGSKNEMINNILKKYQNGNKDKLNKKIGKSKHLLLNENKIRICIYKKSKMISNTESDERTLEQTHRFSKDILLSASFSKYKKFPIALCSNNLINKHITKSLINLIKPLQNKIYNYRDPKFIKSEGDFDAIYGEIYDDFYRDDDEEDDDFSESMSSIDEQKYIEKNKNNIDKITENENKSKPILKELIAKFQHFYENKRILNMDNKPINFPVVPAIFNMKKKLFLTEINGLLYSSNIKLYKVIGNIFNLFIPMFSWCTGIKLNEYNQLSVIIKMHEYIFENENDVVGIWHTEGNKQDDIIAVGLYYFDDDNINVNNQNFKFNTNILEIAEEKCVNRETEIFKTAKISIGRNDCIVFKNAQNIKHRIKISTKLYQNYIKNVKQKQSLSVSRKTLCFFLLNPKNDKVSKYNANDFKWINFPWKIDIILNFWFKNNDNNKIYIMYDDILLLITNFAFGDKKYQQEEMSNIRSDRRSDNFYTLYRRPFHVERIMKYRRYDGVDD